MKKIEINSLLLKLEGNKAKLNVQEKRFIKYKELLEEIKNKNPFKKQKDFQIKDSDFLNELKNKPYNNVAIFAHGGVLICAGIYGKLFKKENAFENLVDYGGIQTIEI